MKKIAILLAVCMIISLLAGCQQSTTETQSPGSQNENTGSENTPQPESGGTVIVGLSGDPLDFNPDNKADSYLYPLAQNIYSRLVKINNNQQIVPDLAKSYELSEDGLELTFHLNDGISWHDGQPFTAEDVKFTFDTIINENGQLAGSISSVQEILAPDDNTVVFKLNTNDSSLLGYLAWDGCFILPKHIYEGTDWSTNEANQRPVGTGPFKFEDYKKGVSITLARNEEYWSKVPMVEKIVYSIIPDSNTAVQAFYNGELDILGILPPLSETATFESNDDVVVGIQKWPSRYYVCFNTAEGIFSDVRLRQAVAYGVDKDDIIKKALKGIGDKAQTAMTPLYDWALNTEDVFPERDVEKAKSLLEEAGLTQNSDGMYLNVTFDVFNEEPFPDIVTVIKDNLKEVGIDVKINLMETAAWDEKVWYNRNYDMALLAGYQGPEPGALASRFSTEGLMNIMNYSNSKVDEALQSGSQYVKNEERAPYYKEAQKYIVEDAPIVPIAEYYSVIPYQSYLKGHPTSPEAIDKTGFEEYTYLWIDK